jgi:hypothetical protein
VLVPVVLSEISTGDDKLRYGRVGMLTLLVNRRIEVQRDQVVNVFIDAALMFGTSSLV